MISSPVWSKVVRKAETGHGDGGKSKSPKHDEEARSTSSKTKSKGRDRDSDDEFDHGHDAHGAGLGKGRDKDGAGEGRDHDRDRDDEHEHEHEHGHGHGHGHGRDKGRGGCGDDGDHDHGGGNDGRGVLTVADVTVIEGGFALATIVLDHSVRNTVHVWYSTADGTAQSGADYTGVSGRATIRAGETQIVVKVPITSDFLDEADETFLFNLTKATGARITDSQAVITILDDDAPVVAAPLTGEFDEDAPPYSIDLLTGIADGNGDQPWVQNIETLTRADGTLVDFQLSGSVLTLDPDQFTDLDEGEIETLVLSYQVTDGSGSAEQTLTLNVHGLNDAPSASEVFLEVSEDGPAASAAFAGADADRGAVLTYQVLTQPDVGVVIDNADGTFSYDPAGAFESLHDGETRQVSFAYSVRDEHGAAAQAVASILVVGVNDDPNAQDDRSATLQNQARLIAAADLTANDFDVEGDALDLVQVGDAIGGGVVLDADGNVLFTPDADFVGEASFRYTVSDGHGGFDSAQVIVKVLTLRDNTAPVAVDDFLLGTDWDDVLIDGAGSTTLVGGAGHDTLIGGAGDDVLMIDGDDLFSGGDGNDAVVVIGDGPVVVDAVQAQVETVIGGGGGDFVVIGDSGGTVLGGGGSDTVYTGADVISGGDGYDTVIIPGDAVDSSFTWTPGGGWVITGPDGSSTTITGIEELDFGDLIVEFDENMITAGFRIKEDMRVTIPAALLLANDSDPDGDALSLVSVQSAVNAQVSLTPSGNISFQGLPDFNGLATFAYTISDGAGGTASATVTVKVWPVNDAPQTQGQSFTTNEDTPLAVDVAELLANDSDVDGDTLTATALGNAVNGTVALVDGQAVFTPDSDFFGEASFDYTVSDGHGGTATQTVNVTVTPVNDAPALGADFFNIPNNDRFIVSAAELLANDSDVDGDLLAVTAVGDTVGGNVELVDGQIIFTPYSGFIGKAGFVYTVNDGHGGVAQKVVNLAVEGTSVPASLIAQDQEFANQTVANRQTAPSTAVLEAGGHVVVWQSLNQSDPDWGVFGRLYDQSGNAVGGEFHINTVTTGDQYDAKVAALSSGGFVVTWSTGLGVSAKIYDANGVVLGQEITLATFTGASYAEISAMPDGGFIATWQRWYGPVDGSEWGVYGRRYNASGQPVTGEFLVNTAAHARSQFEPVVAVLSDGSFVVAWAMSDSNWDIYIQRFSASGAPLGANTRISSYGTQEQRTPTIAALSDGSFVVAWRSMNQDASDYGIFAQRMNAAGGFVGGEFRVNDTTTGAQTAPSLTGLADGGFLAAWESNGQDGSDYGVYARRYDASGSPVGGEFLLAQTTAGAQQSVSVSARPDGGFVASWTSNDGSGEGIVTRVFPASPEPPVVVARDVLLGQGREIDAAVLFANNHIQGDAYVALQTVERYEFQDLTALDESDGCRKSCERHGGILSPSSRSDIRHI